MLRKVNNTTGKRRDRLVARVKKEGACHEEARRNLYGDGSAQDVAVVQTQKPTHIQKSTRKVRKPFNRIGRDQACYVHVTISV